MCLNCNYTRKHKHMQTHAHFYLTKNSLKFLLCSSVVLLVVVTFITGMLTLKIILFYFYSDVGMAFCYVHSSKLNR